MAQALHRKPNVLAVDDKSANLLALEAALSDSYNVISVNSGQDAIKLLTEQPNSIDLVLMDVQMPDMDGFEAATRIKKLPGCEDMPIIFISAIYVEDPHIRKGYAAGGIDYLTKPFDLEVLKIKLGVYAFYKLHDELVKARETRVRESEELLRIGRRLSVLLEGLPIGAIITDLEGRVWQGSDELSRILGSGVLALQGEILGWWDASGRMTADRDGPLARTLRAGESSHSELQPTRCADGTSKTIVLSTSPLKDRCGGTVGAVVLVHDLTESKKVIGEELEARIRQLMAVDIESGGQATR